MTQQKREQIASKRVGSLLVEVSVSLAMLVAVAASLSMLTKTLSGGRASLKELTAQRASVESTCERLAGIDYEKLQEFAVEFSRIYPVRIDLRPAEIAGISGTRVLVTAADYPSVELSLWRFPDTEVPSPENKSGDQEDA